MSHSKLAPSVFAATMRNANALAQVRRREPYAIERYPAVQGSVMLVGYDGRGEVMVELRIPTTRYSDRMMDRMRRWMKRQDEPAPAISLIP